MSAETGTKKMKISEITFVTGNAKKLEEFQAIIGDTFRVVSHKLDRESLSDCRRRPTWLRLLSKSRTVDDVSQGHVANSYSDLGLSSFLSVSFRRDSARAAG